MTHLSLFTGIGGLDLAAAAAGFQTVGQCEWADYPTRVLEKHWPDVPRWRDIRTLTGGSFYEHTGLRTVDVISGGFPCQPFSVAGKRRGREDDRYLWPEMLRIVEEIRPRWVVGENVAGIVNMALDTVLADLEGIGYACRTFLIPACAVDAPHRRDRCAIVGYAECAERRPREPGGDVSDRANAGREKTAGWPGASGQDGGGLFVAHSVRDGGKTGAANQRARSKGTTAEPFDCREALADAKSEGLPEFQRKRAEEQSGPERCGEDVSENGGERPAQPGLGMPHDGLPGWMAGLRERWADGTWEDGVPRIAVRVPDRGNKLKCLGNAVVPAQFYPIFQAIADIEKGKTV